MEKDKHLGLRIDSDTHKKLKNLADFLISNKNALFNGFEMLEIFLGIFKQQKATDQPKSRTGSGSKKTICTDGQARSSGRRKPETVGFF